MRSTSSLLRRSIRESVCVIQARPRGTYHFRFLLINLSLPAIAIRELNLSSHFIRQFARSLVLPFTDNLFCSIRVSLEIYEAILLSVLKSSGSATAATRKRWERFVNIPR